MPEIFLLCSSEDAVRIKPYTKTISEILRTVTADVLSLNSPNEAGFMIIPFTVSDNVARFIILCVSSHSPKREAMIKEWRNDLAEAWASIAPIVEKRWASDVELFQGGVEVFPTMPVGLWGLFLNGKLIRG